MLRKCIYLMSLLFVCVLLFAGCSQEEKVETTVTTVDIYIDYSEYEFVNTSWKRDAENDTETIRFDADGHFVYYCACGNPVNDSDLCENYTYDDTTKTITLHCYETTDEMITTIKIVKCDENSLHLDFDGEIRIFNK